jgi:hypothetical protein
MVCAGHYATETFGVKALARAVAEEFGLDTEFLPRATAVDAETDVRSYAGKAVHKRG